MDNFSNKTVLITGGTSGIGFAVAKQCIDNHYQVIIVGSSEERSIPAKNEINAKYPNADVVFFYADLSVQKIFIVFVMKSMSILRTNVKVD